MGTITINISNEAEEKFRKTVENEKGTGKGKLGEATEEAIIKWVDEKRQKNIAESMIKLLDKGFDMGKVKIKHRSELYDR